MMKKMCGARNISSFRRGIEKLGSRSLSSSSSSSSRSNFSKPPRVQLPQKESITYEGLFSTYYFPIGKYETKQLVEPVYAVSQCKNEMTDEIEKFVSLGLVSSRDGINEREELNLVVVLDISGSMGGHLDGGYSNSSESVNTGKKSQTIMDVAKDVLIDITKIMKEEERLGIVLFDTRVEILQPFREVSLIDREEMIEKIKEVLPRGGTNMEIGMKTAMEMISDAIKDDEKAQGKNNRIIFLTDACPNVGGGPNTLLGLTKKASKNKIYTTFIGMGLDFNAKLIEQITKVRGSNYYSVYNQREFKKILNEDFNYTVTPIVFDCVLFFESEGLEIEKAYGTPFADESSGALTKIETLSASPKDERGIQGSIILLKIKEKLSSKMKPSQDIKLTLRFELKTGKKVQQETKINFKESMEKLVSEQKIYQNLGIRKCILLQKFATLLRDTIDASNNRMKNQSKDGIGSKKEDSGPFSNEMKEDMKKFKTFFKNEMEVLGDKKLSKEIDLLDRILYFK